MTLLAHRGDDSGATPAATDPVPGPADEVPSPADDAAARIATDEPAPAAYVHSPVYLARLIAFGIVFVALVLATRALPHAFVGLDLDATALPNLSPALRPFLSAYVITLGTGFVVVAVGIALSRGYPRYAAVIGGSFALAFGLAYGAFIALVSGRPYDGSAPWMVAVAAGAVAVLAVVSDDVPRAVLRAGWWALLPAALLVGAWTGASIAAEVLAVAGGAAIGVAVALLAGTPSRAPGAAALTVALEQANLRVAEVAPHDVDARASVPWLATLSSGTRIFVKTHTTEERSADLLFRVWRMVRLRRPGDERPEASLRRAVEHEAFVATRAGQVGVRTPRLVTVGRLGSGGMFAAYEVVDGVTFDDLGDELEPATLRSVWSMARSMHRAGVAHRDLRAANLLVDEGGDAWVVDFGFAELAATRQQMRLDVVELLASTATVVGIDRAVRTAVEVLGPDPIADALPLLQPPAVSAATRSALGKDGFGDLRRAVVEVTGVPEPEEPKLERIRPKTVAMVAALGLAVWILLPQILQQGDLWAQITNAQLGWVAVAIAASATTYVATAVGLLGGLSTDVGLAPTVAAQLASSFTNRITPANVGGMALNTRYLSRAGAGTTAAVTAVGASATAGGVVHLILTVFALAWAGSAGLGGVSVPEGRTLAITGGIVLVVLLLGFAIPRSRRFLLGTVVERAKASAAEVREIARRPAKLVMLFGGSALVTIANLLALYAAVAAFGAAPALSTVAVVYLAGSTIGAAAPTPSGLGALEAALVAGLIATGVDEAAAVAGVLLFRLATFWLPILPGWASFAWLQRSGRI